MRLIGQAFPHKSSDCYDAVLSMTLDSRLLLQVGNEQFGASMDEVKITSSIGTTNTKILFPNGWLFVASAQPDLRRFLIQTRQVSWISRLEDNVLAVLASMALVILLLAGGFAYGLPWLSEKATVLLPDPVAEYVGERVLTSLDEEWFEPSQLAPEQQRYIQQRFQSHVEVLAASGEAFPYPPSIVFRRWNGGINAFALSNGSIIVTDGIVQAMATDAQLDSLLFHELGHVKHEHVMESIVRSSLMSVAVALITGESSGVIDNLAGAGVFLFSSGYSREDEQEADRYAAEMMLQIHGSTAPMQEMFERLQADSAEIIPEWLSTHPDTHSRIEAINQ